MTKELPSDSPLNPDNKPFLPSRNIDVDPKLQAAYGCAAVGLYTLMVLTHLRHPSNLVHIAKSSTANLKSSLGKLSNHQP